MGAIACKHCRLSQHVAGKQTQPSPGRLRPAHSSRGTAGTSCHLQQGCRGGTWLRRLGRGCHQEEQGPLHRFNTHRPAICLRTRATQGEEQQLEAVQWAGQLLVQLDGAALRKKGWDGMGWAGGRAGAGVQARQARFRSRLSGAKGAVDPDARSNPPLKKRVQAASRHLWHVVHVLAGWAVQAGRPACDQLHVAPALAALAQHLAAAGQGAEAGLEQGVHALQGATWVEAGRAIGRSQVWGGVLGRRGRQQTSAFVAPQFHARASPPACLDVRHEEGKLGLELVQTVGHHRILVRLAL